MKKTLKKSIICVVVVICLLLNSYVIFSGLFVRESSNKDLSASSPKIVYSSDNNVSFEKIAPIYKENSKEDKLSIIRSGEVSDPLKVTVAVYDNSADYGTDYILKYNCNKIEKLKDSRSIFEAFRDDGIISSNIPVNAAEILVTYDNDSADELTEDVNAAEMFSKLNELGSRVAEFEVVFGAGEALADIYIELIDDKLSEYSESFILVLFGSDDNVIETCNKYNMAMAFTGMRLFHH